MQQNVQMPSEAAKLFFNHLDKSGDGEPYHRAGHSQQQRSQCSEFSHTCACAALPYQLSNNELIEDTLLTSCGPVVCPCAPPPPGEIDFAEFSAGVLGNKGADEQTSMTAHGLGGEHERRMDAIRQQVKSTVESTGAARPDTHAVNSLVILSMSSAFQTLLAC